MSTLLIIIALVAACIRDAFAALIGIAMGILLCNAYHKERPQAADVYAGKTVLQINYHVQNGDTVACDSTVVWKEITNE